MAAQGRAINVMGKPVYLLFNGDIFKRKRIVVNQRKMRSFDSFLDAATTSLGKPAREIRTPHGRTRIRNLEDLQRDCTYVVMGREKKPFKEVDYASSRFHVQDFRTQRLAPLKEPEVNFLQLNHRKFGNVPGKARISGLRVKEEIKTIIVFCNGIVSKPRRVQLRTDFKMYQVLESVNDKVSSYSKNGAVYELYTLDGHKIYEPHELDDNGQYVAVGRERHFDRSVSYNDQGVGSQLTPRRASTKPKVTERKPPAKHRGVAKRTGKKSSLVADNDEPITSLAADITRRGFSEIKSSPEPVKEEEPQSLFDSFKETVTESLRDDDEPKGAYVAERRNSSQQSDIEDIPLQDTIQEKVVDVLGDHGVPVGGLFDDKEDKSQEDRRNSSDNVHPSVYEASGENRIDATEIQEDKETEEDKPIDQMPAEEVADEEIEAEDNENGEEADEEVNNEARDSETRENPGEEGNNNEAEEVQEDEIEENDEAKEEDDEKDHPEVNEASEDNETNEPLDENKANEPNDTSDPTEESEPQESLK